ncbi:protein ligase LubX [Seminavis robusta]|uniref:Protein ligase LubX n=1 Tax=Seminavis robusta TaxID=568900 RepID=A0A9N8EAL4_9STRA|nr:protein ligase LubX [Seminavis robusta]|eukprot:Sro680_g186290.1 protein ligase LubX (652) ;mRNA; f:43256-45211
MTALKPGTNSNVKQAEGLEIQLQDIVTWKDSGMPRANYDVAAKVSTGSDDGINGDGIISEGQEVDVESFWIGYRSSASSLEEEDSHHHLEAVLSSEGQEMDLDDFADNNNNNNQQNNKEKTSFYFSGLNLLTMLSSEGQEMGLESFANSFANRENRNKGGGCRGTDPKSKPTFLELPRRRSERMVETVLASEGQEVDLESFSRNSGDSNDWSANHNNNNNKRFAVLEPVVSSEGQEIDFEAFKDQTNNDSVCNNTDATTLVSSISCTGSDTFATSTGHSITGSGFGTFTYTSTAGSSGILLDETTGHEASSSVPLSITWSESKSLKKSYHAGKTGSSNSNSTKNIRNTHSTDIIGTKPTFPEALYCSETKILMKHPMVGPDGYSIDKSVICSRAANKNCRYYPNRALQDYMEQDCVEQKFRRKGSGGLVISERQRSISKAYRSFPDVFYCPISLQLIRYPKIDPDGITYEADAIEQWVKANGDSPVTGRALTLDELYANNALKQLMLEEIMPDDCSQVHPSIRQWKQQRQQQQRRHPTVTFDVESTKKHQASTIDTNHIDGIAARRSARHAARKRRSSSSRRQAACTISTKIDLSFCNVATRMELCAKPEDVAPPQFGSPDASSTRRKPNRSSRSFSSSIFPIFRPLLSLM